MGSPVGYLGSKATTGLCQMLPGLQPARSAIESHLGGGARMKRKAPAPRLISIDRYRRALDGACDRRE